MGLFEALVLFAIGLLFGIVATVFDVLAFGAASFVAHASLWVLVNAVFSSHVGSRKNAVLWAIPFNLGYIESYYLTMAATYEGYAKSLVVPLAAMALIGPTLSLALWTAKQERNIFGKILTLLIVAGTLVSSYFIDGVVSIYDGVICVLTALVLLVWPTRRFDVTRVSTKRLRTRLTRTREPQEDLANADGVLASEEPEVSRPEEKERRSRVPRPTKRASKRSGGLFGRNREDRSEASRTEKPHASDSTSVTPTRRRGSDTTERATRASRIRNSVPSPSREETSRSVSTLGTARTARPSSRTRRY